MVFLQADAAAQTINEAAAQPVVATDAAAATTTTTTEQPDGAPVQPTGVAAFLGNPLFMFVIIIAIMYFLMIRPQRKRQKEIENFRKSLTIGSKVITASGVYGTVKSLNEGLPYLTIEVSKGVTIQIDRNYVYAEGSQQPQQQ